MFSNKAWQRHGCYYLGSEQYYNMPLEKSLFGCMDDWNSLDHFDPTADSRRMTAHMFYLRSVYSALEDGFSLVQLGNWTYEIQRPGSNGTATEMGLYSLSRSGIANVQTLSGNKTDQIWLLYTNENTTQTYTYDCNSSLWISSPYTSGTVVRNLFAPFETYTLEESLSPYFNDGNAPYFGCLGSISFEPYGFKALVPQADWVAPRPALTKFSPGHDYRILSNSTSVSVTLEYNVEMDCDSVTNSLTLNMTSSGQGGTPTVSNVQCTTMTNADPVVLSGDTPSAWSWTATIQNFPDGILQLILDKPSGSDGTSSNVRFLSFLSIYFYVFILLLLTDGYSTYQF